MISATMIRILVAYGTYDSGLVHDLGQVGNDFTEMYSGNRSWDGFEFTSDV
jgi:hypothetical protein